MKRRKRERRERRRKDWDDYHACFIQIRPLKKVVMNRRTDVPTNRQTDGPLDQRTDKASYRDAWTHLKIDLGVCNIARENENGSCDASSSEGTASKTAALSPHSFAPPPPPPLPPHFRKKIPFLCGYIRS